MDKNPVLDIPSASQIPFPSSCYSAGLFFFHYALAGHTAFSEFTLDGDAQVLTWMVTPDSVQFP